jgi:two-component system cell cycle response regulator CpdR
VARILIAEDDDAARLLLSRALELDGHAVHAVADGAAALEYLQGGGETDLLLTDISMPLMDGIALALSVSRDHPALPILLMTGFSEQRERASGLDALIKGVIVKPFQIEDVRTKIRDVLGEQKI